MKPRPSAIAAPFGPPSELLPVLLLLFVGSGLCALIYEVVWFQLLELVIGSSAISLGVLLATFMGGMCIGSLVLPRMIPARLHPLRVYAALELGVGIIGLIELIAVPLVGNLYSVSVGHGFFGVVMRALVVGICLLPPTILMGATLPAVARWLESSQSGVSWLGFFYGGNTAGAVIGAVLAGFYLLRVYDLRIATLVAALLNATVAAIAYSIASRAPFDQQQNLALPNKSVELASGSRVVYVVIALSGLCALGAEVVWTRLLSLMLGASTYTFSIILGVFLTGLGLGSAAGAFIARAVPHPRLALGWAQGLQMLTVAWGAWMIASVLPYWPINPSLAPNPLLVLHLDLTRCAWAVLPGALLWGASFPLALASVARTGEDSGRLVGGVYAANTLGAIIGALGFSLILVPNIGTQRSEQALVAISAVAALLVFAMLLSSSRRAALTSIVVAAVMAFTVVPRVPEIPPLLVAYGRYMVTWLDRVDVKYFGEGMNSSVAVTTLLSSGATQFHVAGKVEASNLPQDMRLQRMLGHLPALVHPNPKSVLIVGFGAGVTAGSFVPYPEIARIVICEIEPLIPQVVSTYFKNENNDVLHDKRTQVYFDDARSFILTTREKFDIITSDPIHPWVKGAASLYTEEYFRAVKEHLNPGGVVSQWVPLYESNMEAVKSEVATFLKVFPNGTVWANNVDGKGYDVVMLGGRDSLRVNAAQIEARMHSANYQRVVSSLGEVGFGSALELFATYGTQASDLGAWTADAQINRDSNLRLQYLAGTGLNIYNGEGIYAAMARGRKFPTSLFVGDEQWTSALRAMIQSTP